MNRTLQGYFLRLNQAADRIERATAASRDEIAKLKQDKQELTQKYWARGRKAAVMAETSDAFDAMRAENAALKEKIHAAREHAAQLRTLARALKEGVEP